MRLIVLALLCPLLAHAQSFDPCGEIDPGARDYRGMNRHDRLHIEGAHFTRDVETLRRGNSGSLGGDLDYTLRHMPNNPRALASLMKLGQRQGTERISGLHFPVGCYFERAVRFAPNDGTVRFTFGMYLLGKRDPTAARAQFDAAAEYAGDNATLHYNLGLVFLDLSDLEAARRHAKIAYANGGMPQGLANRLRKAGQWDE